MKGRKEGWAGRRFGKNLKKEKEGRLRREGWRGENEKKERKGGGRKGSEK